MPLGEFRITYFLSEEAASFSSVVLFHVVQGLRHIALFTFTPIPTSTASGILVFLVLFVLLIKDRVLGNNHGGDSIFIFIAAILKLAIHFVLFLMSPHEAWLYHIALLFRLALSALILLLYIRKNSHATHICLKHFSPEIIGLRLIPQIEKPLFVK